MLISIVVAFGAGRVIGKDGKLPWNLPSDLARFRQITLGGSVIMGRKTFDSIVERNGVPLDGRENIVLTKNSADLVRERGCIPASSVQQALATATSRDRIFVIGGAEIFPLFLPLAKWAYLTKVKCRTKGDAHLPERWSDGWKVREAPGFKPTEMGFHHQDDSHESELYMFKRGN
jgi:dihydrofolate reductase